MAHYAGQDMSTLDSMARVDARLRIRLGLVFTRLVLSRVWREELLKQTESGEARLPFLTLS
ncbi:hypothetical protein CGLO_11401 [Colletotrichum gloeosporioides Cg-14]|uniref:Uncharacterized protein n=1 Tax=Colletotrichum gloeosporioides (strain Cg-14) TaxID=1237896 RepID=T0K0U9_COLGC|nr:hypothetical protein CGLO_11401 [Colletotrichum gloeosporioides Cg-14]